MTNGTTSYVLSMLQGYYTFSEFIEAVISKMVKVLPLVLMTITDDHAVFNITSDESWYFDQTSDDRTIDGKRMSVKIIELYKRVVEAEKEGDAVIEGSFKRINNQAFDITTKEQTKPS